MGLSGGEKISTVRLAVLTQCRSVSTDTRLHQVSD